MHGNGKKELEKLTKHKIIALVFFQLIIGSFLFAQNGKDERYNDGQPLRRRPGLFRFFTGLRDRDSNEAKKFDRFFVDVVHNNFHGDLNGTRGKWYSFGFNFSYMGDIPFNKRSKVGIGLGLGFSHWDLHHNGDFTFIDEGNNGKTDYTELARLPDSIMSSRIRNKLGFNYIEVPFEFRFRNRGKTMFKFYPGFKVGVLTNMFTKEYDENGSKFKDYSFPDKFLFTYGPTIRIGINSFFLFGYYNLAPLFKDSRSSQLHTFSFGISFGLFSEKRVN